MQASVSEDAAWGYFMQLAAALRAVHSMGLACRAALAPSKVLLLPGNRLRLGRHQCYLRYIIETVMTWVCIFTGDKHNAFWNHRDCGLFYRLARATCHCEHRLAVILALPSDSMLLRRRCMQCGLMTILIPSIVP